MSRRRSRELHRAELIVPLNNAYDRFRYGRPVVQPLQKQESRFGLVSQITMFVHTRVAEGPTLAVTILH